jgi:hypothetical protein
MKATMLLVLLTISTAQAAEPKGTLTLACKGIKSETTPRIADADQSSISVDIIIDFGARTVTGFPLPPVCNLDQPVISLRLGTSLRPPSFSPVAARAISQLATASSGPSTE